MDWKDKVVLITGGTGSFGKKFIQIMLKDYQPAKIIVFSRDELKQHEMRQSGYDHPSLRYFIGDVRDQQRLRRALNGVDIVVHAAALKQVPACEYNPMEAIKTNILGSSNVVEAALDAGVSKVLALSTDKAVNPVNLYGATKLCAEKLIIQSNAYAAGTATRFSCVRYGNVVGSRGSVVPVFIKQRQNNGKITITDDRMTRFWISLEQGVRFVIRCLEQMRGGEVFVPKIPSMKVVDLAKALAPATKVDVVGIRPGEKLHETLISEDEARNTIEMDDMYVVQPAEAFWFGREWITQGQRLEDGYRYSSNTNEKWLSVDQIRQICAPIEESFTQGKIGMTRFLVTGASGLLGVNFGMEFAAQSEVVGVVNQHALVGAPFKVIQADLRQPAEVDRVLDEIQPDVVMNCAALAILDECETRPDQAERVNTRLPLQLAVKTAEQKIRLVHISTDSVFDGRKGDYTETDRPNPLSVYAMTKLEGERAVLDANPDALVARVNFYGWSLSSQRSLSEFFFRNLSQGTVVKGFTDVFFCPLQVNELARLLARLAALGLSGLYHVVSSECMSKYDFGVAIARQFGFDEKLVLPTSVQDSGLKAPRSPRLTLRTEKAAAALGAALPGLQPGLEMYYRQWVDGYTDRIRLLGKTE